MFQSLNKTNILDVEHSSDNRQVLKKIKERRDREEVLLRYNVYLLYYSFLVI